jgi:dihydropteroate synthase
MEPSPVVELHSRNASVVVGGPDVVLMGVINRSPESANKDVYADSPEAAVQMAAAYAHHGVTVIDVGGQSTNYENPDIGVAEELRRLVPTVEALAAAGHVVSVDTWKPEVVEQVVAAGAGLINDTGGLKDPRMVEQVAAAGIPAVLMYLEADGPNAAGDYDTAAGKSARIAGAIGARRDELVAAGIREVIVDPGVAISYRSYAVPRKEGRHRNVALAALAMHTGADMLRIHDVEMIADVARLMGRLSEG